MTRRTAFLAGLALGPIAYLFAVILAADLWAAIRWIGARA